MCDRNFGRTQTEVEILFSLPLLTMSYKCNFRP